MRYFTLRHRNYVAQVDESDCGVACLAMILKYYHSRVSLAYLRRLARTNTEGTTALGLVKAAQKLNFSTLAVKATMAIFDNPDTEYPLIAHVLKNGELLHYYVVLSSSPNNLIIADPDNRVGIIKMSRERFAQEWSGIALQMKPNENFVPVKEKQNGLIKLFPYVSDQPS